MLKRRLIVMKFPKMETISTLFRPGLEFMLYHDITYTSIRTAQDTLPLGGLPGVSLRLRRLRPQVWVPPLALVLLVSRCGVSLSLRLDVY